MSFVYKIQNIINNKSYIGWTSRDVDFRWDEHKKKRFKDYKEVIPFVNSVMKIADKQNHHPDMTVHYDNVKLSITDHDKGGVSQKCHKFINVVDKI